MKNKHDLIDLIKKSGAIRKFKNKDIDTDLVKLIVEAGLWGPSVFGIQPWHFVVITKKCIIEEIALAVSLESQYKEGGLEKLLQRASKIILNSKILIAIYSNNRIKKGASRYGNICMKKGWMAELLSCGAAVQNMFLTLNLMGLGAVWLDAPTIFPSKVNKILNEKDELVTFLAIGYPDQKAIRSKRNYGKTVTIK